ncbi:hypothetical protein KC946_03435 [Candidatus Saccharibacteria bacterium]|nr:hypothetical protein [Candidatus Saccharibacteria bacterium]
MSKNKRYKSPKPRPGAWFTPVRGSYLPVRPAGWLTYIPFLWYLLFTLILGIQKAASLISAVLFIGVNWIVATTIMTYIAKKNS